MVGTSNDQYLSGDDGNDVIVHEGKHYRRVQIEGKDEEYLMDEDANIYTMDMKQIGKAGDSDEEEGDAFWYDSSNLLSFKFFVLLAYNFSSF